MKQPRKPSTPEPSVCHELWLTSTRRPWINLQICVRLVIDLIPWHTQPRIENGLQPPMTHSSNSAFQSILPVPLILVAGLIANLQTDPASAQNLEVIDNRPFEISRDAITAPLVSIRPLAPLGLREADNLERLRFTKETLLESAGQFPRSRPLWLSITWFYPKFHFPN